MSRASSDAVAKRLTNIETKVKSASTDHYQELRNQSAKREVVKSEGPSVEPPAKRTKLGR